MSKNIPETYALITGASKGLGKAFSFELAKRKINIILVSLPGENLKDLAHKLKQSGCNAIYYETDLTQKENLLELTRWVNNNFKIHILINNAGVGGDRQFLQADVEYISHIIQLNVMATSLLTHQLLPNLLKQEKGYVLNVSSMAAWSPIGYKTVYPASKAFVHSFTRGLQEEFSQTGVSFSVVNPGPMESNGDIPVGMEKMTGMAKSLIISPEKAAAISIKGLFKRKPVIKLTPIHRFGWFLLQIFPVSLKRSILSRTAKKRSEIRTL